MAFQAIASGSADCGPSNPLQALLKHTETDLQSSRFDGLSRAGPSDFRSAGRSRPTPVLSDPSLIPSGSAQHEHFDMSAMRNELESFTNIGSLNTLTTRPRGWNSQFMASTSKSKLSPEELLRMEQHFQSSSNLQANPRVLVSHGSSQWTQQFIQSPLLAEARTGPASIRSTDRSGSNATYMNLLPHRGAITLPLGGLNLNRGASFLNDSTPQGKIVELSHENWEAEFNKIDSKLQIDHEARFTSEDPQSSSQSSTTKAQSTHLETGDRSENTQQISSGDDNAADEEFMKSLENTWKNLASNLNSASLEDHELEAWENEMYGSQIGPHPTSAITVDNVDDFLTDPTPYPFQENNKFLSHPDPFQEGHRLIASGAPLCEAALAFEAACFLDSTRADAWRVLGETNAADEKEQLAIKAFEKAVGCGGPDGLASRMSLAICWVNENQETRAYATLERWLMETYPDIGPAKEANDPTNPWQRHSAVVDQFISAARAGPAARQGVGKEAVRQQIVDADVQVGLGVLFFGNAAYDQARDCFEAALGVNPNDFMLWNRLGATLANGGQSEEAIEAYRKALELRPTFTRAIYNLGVSCLNIHCYREAAEHILAALSLHHKSSVSRNSQHPLLPEGDGSDNLWHTLRRAFQYMNRPDLAEKAEPLSDVENFRAEGFDF